MLRCDVLAVFLLEPPVDDAARAILSDEDRAHVDRFRFERDRAIALASRTLQRRALSACAPEVPPAAWRFVADARGRPQIAAPASDLTFSVANCRGLVGCAVARGAAVGLDLEPWRDDAPPELVERCFTADEQAGLAALPPAARPRRFVELWVVKEAYLKARGVGLDLPLHTIHVGFDPLRLACDDDDATWQVALWSPTPDHGAALCVRRSAPLPSRISSLVVDLTSTNAAPT
jgi:4'-phosphopantetheinyl transferase